MAVEPAVKVTRQELEARAQAVADALSDPSPEQWRRVAAILLAPNPGELPFSSDEAGGNQMPT